MECKYCHTRLAVANDDYLVCLNIECSALNRGGARTLATFSLRGDELKCNGCSNFLRDKGNYMQCPASSEPIQFYNCTDRYTYSGQVIDAEAPN